MYTHLKYFGAQGEAGGSEKCSRTCSISPGSQLGKWCQLGASQLCLIVLPSLQPLQRASIIVVGILLSSPCRVTFPSLLSLYFPPPPPSHISLLLLLILFLSSPCSSCFPPSPSCCVSLFALFVTFPIFSSSCFSPALFVVPSPSHHVPPLALIVMFPSSTFLSCFSFPSPHFLPFLPLLVAFPSWGSLFMSGFTAPGLCCSPHRSLCWHYAGIAGLVPGINLLIAFVFALCWSCFVHLHVLALGIVQGVGTQLLTCVWLGFLGLRIHCPFTGRVGWLVGCLVMHHHHHCCSSDGGGSPPPSLSLLVLESPVS